MGHGRRGQVLSLSGLEHNEFVIWKGADIALKTICVDYGEAPHRVEAVIIFCGPDITVCCGGGEAHHIGAVALAVPRPSLADNSLPSASASVLCVTGHKEDELVRASALELATLFGCRVNVTGGLHINGATAEDIHTLDENYAAVLSEVKRVIADERDHLAGDQSVGVVRQKR